MHRKKFNKPFRHIFRKEKKITKIEEFVDLVDDYRKYKMELMDIILLNDILHAPLTSPMTSPTKIPAMHSLVDQISEEDKQVIFDEDEYCLLYTSDAADE